MAATTLQNLETTKPPQAEDAGQCTALNRGELTNNLDKLLVTDLDVHFAMEKQKLDYADTFGDD